MMKRRDKLMVIRDMLGIIRERRNSILPTPLQRASNLSTERFNEYLAELLAKGLVREMVGPDAKTFITLTDDGFRYLEKYQKIEEFIEEFGL